MDKSIEVERFPSALANRIERSSPEIDESEKLWWQEYADVEEGYCWVQTPAIQKFIRGRYIQRISNSLASNDKVLEFGCGTGWLSVLLAKSGVTNLYAVDFSLEQIRRAEATASASKVSQQIQFGLIDGSLESLVGAFPGTKFDALVIHGVLHHLSILEIDNLFGYCREVLNPNAKVFILEPVIGGELKEASRTDMLIQFIIGLPMRGQNSGWRKTSKEEKFIQDKIVRRNVGEHPRGPSPKEMPFQRGELEALLEAYLIFEKRESVLVFSYHVAKNLLLFRLSYPRLGRLLMWPVLWVARMYERSLLKKETIDTSFSVFELFQAKIKKVNDHSA